MLCFHFRSLTGLLGITPSSNNGTIGSLYPMLTPSLLPTLPPVQAFPGTSGVHGSCPYPTEAMYNARSFCNDCVCSNLNNTQCVDVSNVAVNTSNMVLESTPTQGGFMSSFLSSICQCDFSYSQ